MRKKINEIVGIFPGSSSVDFCLLKRRKRKWFHERLPVNPVGSKGTADEIRHFFKLFGFSKRRKICIALPREQLFMREIPFPNLSPEQALDAAKLSISLYCHIDIEDIYHDEWVFMRGEVPCVLVVYCNRRLVADIIEPIENAGYARSQIIVAPATVGLDILLREFSPDTLPCVAKGVQNGREIISLHGVDAWKGSHFSDTLEHESQTDDNGKAKGKTGLGTVLPVEFRNIISSPVCVVQHDDSFSDVSHGDVISTVKAALAGEGVLTWSLCAAALCMSRYPAIVFQDGIRRRPFKLNINAFKILIVVTALTLSGLTVDMALKLKQADAELSEIEAQEQRLSAKLEPLQSTMEKLEKVKTQVDNLSSFVSEYARPLDILKALADTTPESTWIKSFHYRNGSLRLSAEGGSAIDTMQAWRKHILFNDVKLTSPVTKNKEQEDRFTVDITMSGGKK